MSRSLTEKKDELDRTIKGFLVPIYSEIASNGGQRNMLSEDDFNKVAYGYACSECLAEFQTYMAKCPVCGHERNVQKDIEAKPPQLWLDYLRERNAIERGEMEAPAVVPAGIDSLVRELENDPDVETIPLSKL